MWIAAVSGLKVLLFGKNSSSWLYESELGLSCSLPQSCNSALCHRVSARLDAVPVVLDIVPVVVATP